MPALDDTVEEVLDGFDGTETYTEAEFALRDFSAKEISVNAAKLAVAGGGAPGAGGGWPTSDLLIAAAASDNDGWDTTEPTSQAATQPFHVVTSDNADGSWIEWNVALAAGVWRVVYRGWPWSGSGNPTLSLDDGGGHVDIDDAPYSASAASSDQYIAGSNGDQFIPEEICDDLTIPEDGYYTLRVRVDGKNASSSGFATNLCFVALRRVSA